MEGVCKRFLEEKDKFKWFIDQYFPGTFEKLVAMATDGECITLSNHLNNIWFMLPDSQFNIIENPPGWGSFLRVIET